jgi:tetratricopeptide (TPR) repeat protein
MLWTVLTAGLMAGCASQPAAPPPASLAAPAPLAVAGKDKKTITLAPKAGDDADVAEVLRGVKMIQSGQIMAAIDGPLNGVVHKYEAQYGAHPKDIYSARGMGDAILYAGLGASQKRNVQVLGPAWAEAYWARGYAYGEMARYDDEEVELAKALALAPLDAQYNNELGYVMIQKRDWNKAMSLYETGEAYAHITMGDDAAHGQCVALRGQGYALVELHRLDEAEAKYNECLKITPGEPKSLAEIGYIEDLKKKQR